MMKHKPIKLISIVTIAAFAWQSLALLRSSGVYFAGGTSEGQAWGETMDRRLLTILRPVAFVERNEEAGEADPKTLLPLDVIEGFLYRAAIDTSANREEAATRLGVSSSTLYKKERGKALPPSSDLMRIGLFFEEGRPMPIVKMRGMLCRVALDMAGGNRQRAAELLGINRLTLRGYERKEGMIPPHIDAHWKEMLFEFLAGEKFYSGGLLEEGSDLNGEIVPLVNRIVIARKVMLMSPEDFKGKTTEFKKALKEGAALKEILPEAFAIFREAARRVTLASPASYPDGPWYPTDEQILAATAIHQSRAVEMEPGEGKTLAIAMAAYLNALTGKGVHIHTFNDYLAMRDGQDMGAIFEFLGLTTSVILAKHFYLYGKEHARRQPAIKNLKRMDNHRRQEAYNCDITYGVKDEFIFDYLKDGMITSRRQQIQREEPPALVAVDEGDSALIDEGHDPLIICSKKINGISRQVYRKIFNFACRLVETRDYVADFRIEDVEIKDPAGQKIQSYFSRIAGLKELPDEEKESIIRQALRAKLFYHKDEDYVRTDHSIEIVDPFTGRRQPQRMWAYHLHQFVELKEGVPLTPDFAIAAMTTFQGYYRRMGHLSRLGIISGTIGSDAKELEDVYGLKKVKIPPRKPSRLDDRGVFESRTVKERDDRVVERIKGIYTSDEPNPLLVFTPTIRAARELRERLVKEGISCNLLDGQDPEGEFEIVKRAGQKGTVTVATNAAGRGVHIELGDRLDEIGGLGVISTFLNEIRRIDRQQKLRTARWGKPGWVEMYVSEEDEIFRRFGKDKPQEKSEAHARVLRDKTFKFGEPLDKWEEEYRRIRDGVLDSRLFPDEKAEILQAMGELWAALLNNLQEIRFNGTFREYLESGKQQFALLVSQANRYINRRGARPAAVTRVKILSPEALLSSILRPVAQAEREDEQVNSGPDKGGRLDVTLVTEGAIQTALRHGFVFNEYVRRALYDRDFGYYTTGEVELGFDFGTFAIALSPVYGEMIAEHSYLIWKNMVKQGDIRDTDTFSIVECGAGLAVTAADILEYCAYKARKDRGWRSFSEHLRYVICEGSPVLARQQRVALQKFSSKVTVKNSDALSIDQALGQNSVNGLIFSDELLDAMESYIIRISPDGAVETCVAVMALNVENLNAYNKRYHSDILGQFEQLGLTKQDDILREDQEIRAGLGLKGRRQIFISRERFVAIKKALSRPGMEQLEWGVNFCIEGIPCFVPAQYIADEKFKQYIASHLDEIALGVSRSNHPITTNIIPDNDRFITAAAQTLKKGYVLTMDTGSTAEQYLKEGGWNMSTYGTKWKQPYFLGYTGDVDICVGLYFTMVGRAGEAAGLESVFFGSKGNLENKISLKMTNAREQHKIINAFTRKAALMNLEERRFCFPEMPPRLRNEFRKLVRQVLDGGRDAERRISNEVWQFAHSLTRPAVLPVEIALKRRALGLVQEARRNAEETVPFWVRNFQSAHKLLLQKKVGTGARHNFLPNHAEQLYSDTSYLLPEQRGRWLAVKKGILQSIGQNIGSAPSIDAIEIEKQTATLTQI